MSIVVKGKWVYSWHFASMVEAVKLGPLRILPAMICLMTWMNIIQKYSKMCSLLLHICHRIALRRVSFNFQKLYPSAASLPSGAFRRTMTYDATRPRPTTSGFLCVTLSYENWLSVYSCVCVYFDLWMLEWDARWDS